MSSRSPAVLIVGAGPAGLVLALSLVKNNVPVRIIEKEPNTRIGSRGAGIQPRTLEIYHYLGVLPEILQLGSDLAKIKTFQMRLYELPGGKVPLKTWDMMQKVDPTPSHPYGNTFVLPQDLAEGVLRSHLAKFSCAVELGTELTGFEQDSAGVTAHLKATRNGEDVLETITVDWLVGADGARGVVRKMLGLSFLGETRDADRLIVGDVRIKGFNNDYWHAWGDMSTKMVNLRPDGNGRYGMLIGGPELDFPKLTSSADEMCKFLEDFTGRSDLQWGPITWLSEFRPNMRMVEKFGEGRVFVAGDAAHVHSPFGGQGMNSSVMDAFNLAWKMSLVHRGLASPSLLATYTEERLPVIAEMLNKTTSLHTGTFIAGGLTGGIESAWYRKRIMTQLGVHYRWSSIVLDEGGQGRRDDTYGVLGDELHAGDRAPDAPGLLNVRTTAKHESLSIFEIFDLTMHTVLIFGGEFEEWTSSILTALHPYPREAIRPVIVIVEEADDQICKFDDALVVRDSKGHAYAAYGREDGGRRIVIVRPDGVVGGIVLGSEGLQRYFRAIFN